MVLWCLDGEACASFINVVIVKRAQRLWESLYGFLTRVHTEIATTSVRTGFAMTTFIRLPCGTGAYPYLTKFSRGDSIKARISSRAA